MEKKIIFLDIDGTLTEPGSNIPPGSALRAIRAAQERGHLVFLCSGRNYEMLSPLLSYGFDGVIASSGGYILCGDQVVYDCPMTEAQKTLAMEVLERNGVFRTIECRDGSYTDEGFKVFLREHGEEGGNSELLRWREQIESSLNILPMKEYRGQPVYKIVVMSPSMEQLAQPQAVLQKDFEFCIQDSDAFGIINGEVVNREFDKGKGVERVCRYLGMSIENTIAFGDSMNDKEMMETAAISVCMENGSEAIKAIADQICPPVTKDGLYQGFQRLHLME